MHRRLTPDARRAEIIARTREMIATQGPQGLSLRAVARWCEISAPGLLHHFDGLRPLLEVVLSQRDAEELAAATAFVDSLGDAGTLLDLADALVQHNQLHAAENRNFDALESEAVASADHPAHDYYVHQIVRPLPPSVELARRDYTDPDAVLRVLSIVVDGLRHRWLRASGPIDYIGDWQAIRNTVFDGFAHLRRDRATQ